MKVIESLKELSDHPSDDVKIELKLYNLADDLTKKARSHLKRVTRVLPEFDLHDEKHSEKILYNQEQLLGEKGLNELSAYELFLLQLSAFFHDCAMAPSDWELEIMKLTEGTENFQIKSGSVNNDLKTPFKISSAIDFIETNKANIYNDFKKDVKKWMFSPNTERDLIEYLGELLVDYQNYRNGFADKIRKINNITEFKDLNESIRIDYIRTTHHSRIEIYIKNLEPIFCNAFEQPSWGKQLANDLSKICRSHGENINFINSLNTHAQYYGSESANLQFVAIMLRLGDIIHFSFDRAPLELRASTIFKSEYSFLQWAIKDNGVNYTIKNGLISFRAYCESPESYFKLHQYIDWIETEIQNYFRFERLWSKSYIDNIQDKVDRSNINNDEDAFLPKRGLSFSLNQKRTIELLMGVGLYKDKYACLRELYQNSLDACRCMISQNQALGKSTKGIIEFGIIKEIDKSFLYCVDNGIGMSKHIIETYLLNIGNTYYKSSDFFKYQAKWGGNFTPTSQFGIGILSCFMIGTKIEITTKTIDGEYISCSIDGPHENFYYKKTQDIEKERIMESGTIVRIQLIDSISKILNTRKIEKLGLLLLGNPSLFPEEYTAYAKLYENWENHLYNKVNSFIVVVPNDIEVSIELENDTKLRIDNKPIIIEENSHGISSEDLDFIDYLYNRTRIFKSKQKYYELKDYLDYYMIDKTHNSAQFRTTLLLPKPGLTKFDTKLLFSLPKVGASGVCIDGINISNSNPISLSHYYSMALNRSGILNFTGENRPQLSVDRTSLTSYTDAHEKIASELVLMILKEIITITNEHISRNHIKNDSALISLIWEYIFDKIGFADTIFISKLSNTSYGEIHWKGIVEALNEKISIKEYIEKDTITISNYNYLRFDILTQKLIMFKLLSAKELSFEDSTLTIQTDGYCKVPILNKRYEHDDENIIVYTENWKDTFADYDIISSLFPIVPKHLYDEIEGREAKRLINCDAKIIFSYSNGITAFFKQDPLFVNEKLGLYMSERDFMGKKTSSIYDFEKKRPKIRLFELNDKFFQSEEKKRIAITVYISPSTLCDKEKQELEDIKERDKSYYKGVIEGWSLLVTGMDKNNIIIVPGKCTRRELVSKLPASFWNEYDEYNFVFPDNQKLEQNKIKK